MLFGVTGGKHGALSITHHSLDLRLGQQDIRHRDIMTPCAQEVDIRGRVARLNVNHIRHQLVVHARCLYCLHQIVVVVVDIQNNLQIKRAIIVSKSYRLLQ